MTHIPFPEGMGAPKTWTCGNRSFEVKGLSPYKIGLLDAWLRAHVPNPIQETIQLLNESKDVLSPEERMFLLRDAKQAVKPKYETYDRGGREVTVQTGGWPPTFDSTEGNRIFYFGEGLPYFLSVLLDISEKEAQGLIPHFDLDAMNSLFKCLKVGDDDEDVELAEEFEEDEDNDKVRLHVSESAFPREDDEDDDDRLRGIVDPKASRVTSSPV